MRGVVGCSLLALVCCTCGRSSPGAAPGTGPGTVTVSVAIAQLSLSPASVTGGQSSVGTVTLTGNAPAGGTVVTLSSNNGSATVPGSVSVPSGAPSATFTVTTQAVTSTTDVTVNAAAGGGSQSAVLQLMAAAPQLALVLDPSVQGGQTPQATVELGSPAPAGGAVVTLSSSDEAARPPASVQIPAAALRATFPITTRAVSSDVQVVITATYNGATITATMIVRAPPPSTGGSFSYFSGLNDYVGQGRSGILTHGNGASFAGVSSCSGAAFKVIIDSPAGRWGLIMVAPRGSTFGLDRYTPEAYPGQPTDKAGLYVEYQGRSCTSITQGEFTISELLLDGNKFKRLNVHIRQLCAVPSVGQFDATLRITELPVYPDPAPCP